MNHSVKLITLVLLILIKSIAVGSRIQYKSFDATTSLPSQGINKICQDKDGFIWFVSSGGLFRFDGYEYEQHAFLGNDPNTPLRLIKELQFDDYGRIWLVTNNNILHYYTIATKTLTEVAFYRPIPMNSIAVCGSVLVMGIGGAPTYMYIDKEIKQKIKPIKTSCKSYGTRYTYTDGVITWYILNNHIAIVNTMNKSEIKIDDVIETPVNANSVRADKFGDIWICDNNELHVYNKKLRQWKKIENAPKQLASLEYDQIRDRVWITTQNDLYYINVNDASHTLRRLDVKLGTAKFKKIFIDQQYNIWLITANDLILISFSENNFVNENFTKEINTHGPICMEKDANGSIWYGTYNNGVFVKTKGSDTPVSIIGKRILHFIAPSPDSSVYVGLKKVIYQYKYNKVTNTYETIDSLPKKQFYYGISTKKNKLWVKNYLGLFEIDFSKGKQSLKHVVKDMSPNFLYHQKETNNLFLCTRYRGVLQLKLDENDSVLQNVIYNKSNVLMSNTIEHMCIQKNNTMWVASSEGLTKLSYDATTGKYVKAKNYTIYDGLSDNHVVSVLEENDSTLWLGTRNGLNKFHITQEKFTNYYEAQGFPSNNFLERSALMENDGKLNFGVRYGFLSFDPEKLIRSKHQYKIFLDLLSINGKTGYKLSDLTSLSSNEKNLKFEINIPNYITQNTLRYRYKLVEDDSWTAQFAYEKEIVFNDLPYGSYTLQIQCSNEEQVWNSDIIKIPIHISPPFWLQIWFIIIVILVIIAIILLYIHFSVRQITKKKEFVLKLELEKRLRETDQEKIKFFTNVSHDLKTPLTMISEPLEKMLQQETSEDEREFLLQTVSKNTNRLIKLIDKVLDFSTVQYDGLTLNIQKVNFIDFLENIIKSLSFEKKRKDLHLALETNEKELFLYIDKEKIERVIFNILSNAFKHTQAKDSIILSITKNDENKFVELSVKDSGKGIRKEQLNNLFTRFYQTDQHKEGQGIGLSIVKEYIEAHQGKVSIDSEYGKGTEVKIKLPIEEHTQVTNNAILTKPSNPEQKLEHSILIVEDDEELRTYLSYELSSEYKLYTAKNGKRGIEIAKDQLPDIIITDFMMPEVSGMELCQDLKADIKTSHIPIIMITAIGESEQNLLKSGANDFITKPFKTNNLKLKIKNLITTLQSTKDWVERELSLKPQDQTEVESEETKFIKKLMLVIEEKFIQEKLDINILTMEMGMSKSNLYKKVSQLTGYTVNELITSIKLKKAAELIVKTNYTFSEIINTLGYSDLKHFRGLFKSKYNMTMQEYKKKNT